MMCNRFKAICTDCLNTYEVGDKFTANQFQQRLLDNFKTTVVKVNSNRIQSFFRGCPRVRMIRPKGKCGTYERIE